MKSFNDQRKSTQSHVCVCVWVCVCVCGIIDVSSVTTVSWIVEKETE